MGEAIELEIDDKVVRISNPDRVYFPARGETKLDLVEYYLAVGDGIVNALLERDAKMHDLRVKWLAKFQTVVPTKIAARAIQIDRRLGLAAQIGISTQVPLIQ